jgi:GntR family transcriptional regulator / MocR family aminotransferase
MATPTAPAHTIAGLYIPFDRGAETPYYLQIYQGLRGAILEGRLRRKERLPSTRGLAGELGISRLPVLTAYEQLLHEGYLVGRVGAGTYVAPSVPDRHDRGPNKSTADARRSPDERRPDTAIWSSHASQALAPFRVGLPALDQFPRRLWSRLVARHARQLPAELMAYGGPGGHSLLRSAVAAYLGASRGVRCEPDQVLIVGGSQMALRLCASVLLRSRDVAYVENPGYPGAWRALAASGCTIRGVPVDDGGLVVRALERSRGHARLVYVTPSHQYPLGIPMAATRRLELLDWASRKNAWVVEDDYDSEYRYTSRPLCALQGMDDSERVIYIGTFSKVLFPALRVGYLIVPRRLLAGFLDHRDALDLFPPTLYQSALTDFIAQGHFGRHLRRMRVTYQHRRDALVHALQRDLGQRLEIVNADAGMHLCTWLQNGIDDAVVAERAAERGLSPIALSACYAGADKRSGLVLGFGGSTEAQIDRAARVLSEVIERAARRQAGRRRN